MKLQNIIITTCMAATLLLSQSSLTAQTSPTPTASPSPAVVNAPGQPPKFGPENKPKGEGHRGKRGDPEERLARMKEALELTPEQETKIRDIFKAEREKMKAERQANQGTKPEKGERREKMRESRERMEAAIKAVLTPEQQTKLAAMKEHRREHGPKGGPQKDAPKP